MMANIALVACMVGWACLFRTRRAENEKLGWDVWIAMVWMMISASRPVSLWFQGGTMVAEEGSNIAEGNPINRTVSLLLILLACCILANRNSRLSELAEKNKWLMALIFFCALSTAWSEYTFVALKRWFRHLGAVLFVVVILSNRNGFKSAVVAIKYLAYVLLPWSIILFKYYPRMGRSYHQHSGELMITGVTTHKNSLGMICMVFGLFLMYELHQELKSEKPRKPKLYGDGCLLFVAVWLLFTSGSATAAGAFILGLVFYMALGAKPSKQRTVQKCITAILVASMSIPIAIAEFGGVIGSVVDLTGHSDTFWGRTELWKLVIGMVGNPIFGCGYDSFWLGERLIQMWEIYWWKPTESHNGFIEVYAQLGFVGIGLVIGIIMQGYSKLSKSLISGEEFSRFKMALLPVFVAYNVTEAALLGLHLLWFLLLVTTTDLRASNPTQRLAS